MNELGWQLGLLREIAQPVGDKWMPTSTEANVPYVGLEHISPENPKIGEYGNSSEVISTKNLFKTGDTLFGKLRPYLKKVALADLSGVCSTDIIPIRANQKADPFFLYYLLASPKIIAKAVESSAGNVMPRASWSDLSDIEIEIPPLPEQKKIAEILSGIDHLIQKNTLLLSKKLTIKQGLTKDIFERVKTNSQSVPVDRLLERPLAYGVLKPGPSVPNGVQLVKIQDYKDGRISTKNLHRISKELHHEFRRTELRGGEIIISVVGTIGRVAVVPKELAGANVSRAFAVLACHGKINNQYLAHFLGSSRIQQWFNDQRQGNAQQVLNLGTLRELPVPVPSSEEQTEITLSINSIDTSIARSRKVLAQLQMLKDAISSDLLSGHKRVSV